MSKDDTRFMDLIENIEQLYSWTYVEVEAPNRVRFDWQHGNASLWVNDDLSTEGQIPGSVRKDLKELGLNSF